MKQKIRIGFITATDAQTDRKAWSGLIYKFYESISQCQHAEVFQIRVKRTLPARIYGILLRIFIPLLTGGRQVIYTRNNFWARQTAGTIDRNLLAHADALFVATETHYTYTLETDKPIIYVSDATFRLLHHYYPLEYSHLLQCNVRQNERMQTAMLQRAFHLIAASDWAKQSMVKDYGVSPEKVSVMEFGANIDPKDIFPKKDYVVKEKLHLLFMGVEWERKGAAIAIDTARLLNEQGIPAIIHMAGIRHPFPVTYRNLPYVDNAGFLNKNIPEEYERLKGLIAQSDLFLLPTKAECAGVVFAEASAYGLPILTFDTGGIPNYVINDINGYRLPISATAEDFAEKIKEILKNEKMSCLIKGCAKVYRNRTNWDMWTERFDEICMNIINKKDENN